MTLTFPTIAETVATLYESGAAKGISTAAKRYPHDKETKLTTLT
jgi:hypothetical protein